jgi:hypothetical protein
MTRKHLQEVREVERSQDDRRMDTGYMEEEGWRKGRRFDT